MTQTVVITGASAGIGRGSKALEEAAREVQEAGRQRPRARRR